MYASSPAANTGAATARLGHMRVPISRAMSRPSSAAPKSKANMRTDFSKKMVSVSLPPPDDPVLKNNGLSYPRSAFHLATASGVTRFRPRCMRATSSGVLTVKNSRKVTTLTPIRIGIAYAMRRRT